MLQPKTLSLQTQLCKWQKISQTWLTGSWSSYNGAQSLFVFSQSALTLAAFQDNQLLKIAVWRESELQKSHGSWFLKHMWMWRLRDLNEVFGNGHQVHLINAPFKWPSPTMFTIQLCDMCTITDNSACWKALVKWIEKSQWELSYICWKPDLSFSIRHVTFFFPLWS